MKCGFFIGLVFLLIMVCIGLIFGENKFGGVMNFEFGFIVVDF